MILLPHQKINSTTLLLREFSTHAGKNLLVAVERNDCALSY